MKWLLTAAAAADEDDEEDDDDAEANERVGCCLFNTTRQRSQFNSVWALCMILLTTASTDVCSSNRSWTTSNSVYSTHVVLPSK